MPTSPESARSVAELLTAIEAGAEPDYLFFWGHRATRPEVGAWLLSQWFPAWFELDGHTFATAEHYMMWRKAMLFGDEGTAGQILAAGHPGEAKKLGRLVDGFDDEVWQRERWGIVVAASLAKFGQDQARRDYLVGTGSKVLVEASPYDAIWGIGASRDDPAAADPARWPGLNLLGFALMQARAELSNLG